GRRHCLHHWSLPLPLPLAAIINFFNLLFHVAASTSLARTTLFVVAIGRSLSPPVVRHRLRSFVVAFDRLSPPSTFVTTFGCFVVASIVLDKKEKNDFGRQKSPFSEK
ncbi:hypothetical protein V8G54_011439, partial [Vigna mungo]